jgi:hypothetical protein
MMMYAGLQAQLTGTKLIPGDYATLTAAVTDLNTQGVGAGGVTLKLTANQSLTATLQIGSAALSVGANAATQANPVIIDGDNFTINAAFAGTRTGSLTSGANDAVIVVNGTDYITIKKCTFTEQGTNTTTTTAIENAIAFYNRNATTPFDGVQFATVENCTFNLSKAATAGSAILAGSFIWTGTSSLAWAGFGTTPGDMHRYIDVKNNTFTGSYNHVTYRGATTANGRALTVTGNTFTNIGGGASTAYGVYTLYVDSLIVNNNNFTFSAAHTTTLYGAFASTNSGGRQEFNNNTVTVSSNTTTSATYGVHYTSVGGDRQMNNNTINFGSFPALTTGGVYGLYNTYTGGNSNITWEMNGNTIANQNILSPSATTAIFYLLYNNGSSGTNSNRKIVMNNNTITNNTKTGGGQVYAIFPGTADSAVVEGNTINNFTWTNNSASSSASFYGIYGNGSPLAQRINGNTVSNVSITGTSTSTAGTLQGIRSSTTSTGTAAVYSNTINNLSYGTGTNTGTVTGLFVSTSTPNNIYKNKIYTLTANQAAGAVTGLNLSSGTTNNAYNNLISDLTTPAATGTNAVIGINVSGGTTANLSYNTVYPSSAGDLTSAGATFGGSGIYVSSTVAVVAKNNIVNIKGNASTGYFAAIKRSAGTANVNPTNLTLSNNIYNSNYIYGETLTESTATNLYYVSGGSFGTADPDFNTACGAFKSWKGDAGSFSENNLTGSAGVYQPAGSTFAESGATTTTTPTITDDFNGATRSVTSPDMGALEFTGTLNDASGPNITYTNIGAQNCTNPPSLSAAITDASNVNTTAGTKPRLYYKRQSEANTLGTNTSGANGWKYVEATNSSSPFTFTMNYGLLTSSPVAGDSIEYFVVAQDLATSPNVGGNSVAFAPGFCPTSAALTGSAFPVSNFKKYVINAAPTVTVSATPTTVCANNDATLSVVVFGTGTLTAGTGALTSTTPTPYYGLSTTSGRRVQILFTAAELRTLGLRAGNINSLAFDVTTTVATPINLVDWTLKIGHTTETEIPTGFSSNATETVVGPTGYTPTIGINVHTFSAPFNWNGTSNIVIEICNAPLTATGTNLSVRYQTGPTNSVGYATNAAGCGSTTATRTTLRPFVIFDGQINQNDAFTTYTWNDGTSNVGTNNDTIVVQPAFPMGNTMTYSVTAADASGCSFGGNVVINKNLTAPTGTAAADKLNICYGDSIVLSSNISLGCPPYNYSWSNGTTVVGTNASIKAYPTANTTYTLTVTDNSMQNFSPTAISVIVNAPAPLTTTPGARCGTGTVNLSATKNASDSLVWFASASTVLPIGSGTNFTTPIISSNTNFYTAAYLPIPNSTITQGTGATTTATYSNPFYSLYSNNHTQHLITAAELRQSGLVAGNINSVALDVTAAGTLPMIDLSVKIGTTAATNMSAFVSDPLTTVFTSASLLPTVGINTLTFSSPFNWDGVSNIVLEFCHGNGASTATMSRTVKADNTSYISSIKTNITTAPGTSAATICGDVTSNLLTYSLRPQFIFNGVGKCEGPRIPVAATVTAAPALTSIANDTICNNSSKLLNVTSTLGDFDNYTWSPTTGLFTDAAGTTAYTGGNASSVYVKNTTAGTTSYVVTGTNSTGALCSNTDTIVVRVMPNPTINAAPQDICVSGSTTLSLSSSTGYTSNSLQWQSSPDGMSYTNIASATNATYTTPTLTTTTYYKMVIKDASGNVCSSLPIDTIVVNNPTITGNTPASRCGTGTVNLSATTSGGSTVKWYAAASGGTALYTGNTFTTPVISSTTTFYATAAAGSSTVNTGLPAALTTATSGSGTTNFGLVFDAFVPFTLFSVDVFPVASSAGTPGTVTIEVIDGSSNVLHTATVNVVGNPTASVTGQTVQLNFNIQPGTNLKLRASARSTSITGLMFEPSASAPSGNYGFPYVVPGVLSINTATLTAAPSNTARNDLYYYFYNWLVSTGCEGTRVPVIATVSTPPTLTSLANDTICNNSSKLLNVTSTLGDFDNYSWAPTTGLFTDAAGTTAYTGGNATSVYVKNTSAGTTNYVVTGSNSTGAQCANTDTIVVRVMPNPTINATPENICRTGSSSLTLSAPTGYATNSLQWQDSPDGMSYTNISGATTNAYNTPTLTSTKYYKLLLKDAAGTTCANSPVKTITVNDPTITGTTPGSRCGTGAVIISAAANAGSTVDWYAASTGGSSLFTGNTFTTPVISSTTTYYAAASAGVGIGSVGPTSPSSLGTISASAFAIGTYYQSFDVLTPLTLYSVDIFPTATIGSTGAIEVRNSTGTTLISVPYTVTNNSGTVAQTITLNLNLPVGTGYRIGQGGTAINLNRNTTGAVYPYTSSGINITGNNFDVDYWYYVYKWQYSVACESTTRTAVTATIDNSMGCVPFPVNLLSFKGEKNGAVNSLEWRTATEINNAGFELQRSADGNNFTALTYVSSKAANGNSTGILTYQFEDGKPLTGNSYYRLKQIDKDGKSTLSQVVLIRGNRMNQLVLSNLYPNPTKKDATLILNAPAADKVSIVITDITGRVVLQQNTTIAAGDNIINLPVASLGAGTYMVKCICNNGCETAVKKLIKD